MRSCWFTIEKPQPASSFRVRPQCTERWHTHTSVCTRTCKVGLATGMPTPHSLWLHQGESWCFNCVPRRPGRARKSTHHMHGWVPHTIRQLVVLVGADVDERRDVAVVRAAKKEKEKRSEQNTNHGSQHWGKSCFFLIKWHSGAVVVRRWREKHSLLQGDDVFVARVLPGEPQSQVVGFGAEGSKGAKVTASYSVTTKHTHAKVQPVPEPLDFTQQDWDTRTHSHVSTCCCYCPPTKSYLNWVIYCNLLQ